MTHIFSTLRRRRTGAAAGALVVVAASLTATLASGSTASAAAPTLSAVRFIGGPGHAQHYGWGADTIPAGQPGAGNVLISDYWNFRVTEFDQQGQVVRHVIGKDPTNHQAPYDVAVNPVNGNIAVGDVDSGATVDIYTREGVLLRQCGNLARWNYPAWLDYDASGRLAVADSRGHKIVMVDDATCNVRFEFGAHANANLRTSTPRGIDFAPDGNLWVANNGTRRIVEWDVNATSATPTGRSFVARGNDFRGMIYNPDNSQLYLVQAADSTVDVYSTAGTMVDWWGGYGTGNGRFQDGGRGITRDGSGNIWVGDMPTFRTQKFSPTGQFLTVAPMDAAPPPLGGYNQPQDVAAMPGFVAGIDSFNWRVNVHEAATAAPVRAFGSRLSFNYPRGISADRGDQTWVVANTDSRQVDKYSQTGQRLWSYDAKAWATAVDHTNGEIYVVEGEARRVTVLNRAGTRVRSFASPLLYTPRGAAVDPVDRSLWVANWGNGRVLHFSPTGQLLGDFMTGAAGLTGIEVDQDTVYVSAKLGHHIRMFSKTGAAQGTFGSGGRTLGRFLNPAGLEILGDRLYVMEAGNERIQELRINR